MNKRYNQKEIKLLLQNKVSLAGLVETGVKSKNVNSVLKGIAPGWQVLYNYVDSPNGRIWLKWDDNWYEVKKINSSAQMLHCQVNERSKGYQFILTVVYGFNTVEQKKSLWNEMESMAKGISQPWLIVGDFNVILSTKDRLAGVPVTTNEIKDFGECVRDMGVNELQWTRNYYTWTNKQCGNGRISSRIDRAFGNDDWMDKWGHQHGKGSFKFFNVWTEHESFMEIVETIWKKEYGYNKMKQVWCKLKDLQHVLKQLNRKEFKCIGKQIDMARIEVANVQIQLNEQVTDEFIVKEKELLIKLEKWSLIEESALRQKSRIKWIQLGDANNKYFSSVIKERTKKNK
nr:uncharacterized protein LOC101244567 [Solanum lycopersicum]